MLAKHYRLLFVILASVLIALALFAGLTFAQRNNPPLLDQPQGHAWNASPDDPPPPFETPQTNKPVKHGRVASGPAPTKLIGPFSAGGPDAGGYAFIDSNEPGGPSYAWLELRGQPGVTELTTGGSIDDGYLGPAPVGFSFTFYGNPYTQTYVSSNGYVSFGSGDGNIPGGPLPDTYSPNNDIMPLGGNKYILGGTTRILYKTLSNPTRFVIEVINLDECCTTGLRSTFEIVLYPDGTILTQYQKVLGTTDAVGIENASGTIGLNYGADVAAGLAVRYYPLALYFTPGSLRQFGAPGATVTYTEKLVNNTGMTDTFDLAVSGAWTTTLSITNTGVLSVGASVVLTVQVTLPANAQPADRDVATLRATSRLSPTVYTAQTELTTAVPRIGYVFDFYGNTPYWIHLVETAFHEVVGAIDITAYGSRPFRGALSPDGRWLYATLWSNNRVLVVDTITNTPVITIPVGDSPQSIAFDAAGDYAFVVNRWANAPLGTVSVIDTLSHTVAVTIPVGRFPWGIANAPCLDKMYVTNFGDSSVTVIDARALTVTRVIAGLISPGDIAVSPTAHRAYVANKGSYYRWYGDEKATGSIGVIDTLHDSLIATWPIPGSAFINAVDVSPDGSKLYVTDVGAGFTWVVDAATGQIITSILTDPNSAMTWDVEVFPSSGGAFAYVSNPNNGEIKVLDTATNHLIKTLNVGNDPYSMAIFPQRTAACPAGLGLAPASARRISPAGSTVVYTQTLYNLSGATDSFSLSVSGNWSATLAAASLGPIPQGGSATFTVSVTIPAGAGPAASNVTTLQAASAANPTAYHDTAELTTLTPSGHKGYVFDFDWWLATSTNQKIHVVDTALHEEIGVIYPITYGYSPLRGAISPDGRWAYAGLSDSRRVLVISTTTDSPVKGIDVGSSPQGIAFSVNSGAVGAYAFVVNQGPANVSVIDVLSQTVTKTIPVGSTPKSVASSPCLDKVYVTNRDSGSVSVINVGTLAVSQTIGGFDGPWGVVISPYGHRAYVSNQGDSSIRVIDTAQDVVIATWPVPGASQLQELDLSPDGGKLYVTGSEGARTFVMDAGTGQILATIPGGAEPTWGMDVFPAGAGPFAYVSVPGSSSVDVINTDTNTVFKRMVLSGAPRGHALFPPSTVCPSGRVLLEPSQAHKPGLAGSAVVYDEMLYNLTGADDVFTLAVTSNWPAVLSITTTGALSHGQSLAFTVLVTIPTGVNAGDQDVAVVQATSAASPTVYFATASLTTSVARPGYIFNPDNQQINIVDTLSHMDTGLSIDTSAYGSYPWRGALSPNGQWLYASLRDSSQVLVIDTSTNLVRDSIPVGSGPHGIAFSADGANAYVANQNDDTVSVLDANEHSFIFNLTVGDRPMSVAASPCTNKIYVTNHDANTVSMLNPPQSPKTIEGFYAPWDVVFSPTGERAYVSNTGDGTISVIDTASDTVVANWPVAASYDSEYGALAGLDISPDGHTLYVVDSYTGNTFAVDTGTGHVVNTAYTGGGSTSSQGWEVEAFPAQAGPFFYASSPDGAYAAVVRTDTYATNGSVYLGGGPHGLALFPPNTVCGVSAAAAFTPTTSVIPVGSNVAFTNLSTGTPTPTYTWDLGDGSPASHAVNPTHTYTTTGVFTVTLTATNLYNQAVATGTVNVYAPAMAAFTPTASFIHVGETVAFANLSTGYPAPTYTWNLGDGSPLSNATNPAHTYTTVGAFTVILTATNPYGHSIAQGQVQVVASSNKIYLPILLRNH